MSTELVTFKFLDSSLDDNVVLVLLNQTWVSPEDGDSACYSRFKRLWDNAVFKAAVDGGTNILHAVNKNLANGGKTLIPDLISGDFDSIDVSLLDFYQSQGVEVVRTPDQNFTDFTKCIRIIAEKYDSGQIPASVTDIVCLLGQAERFDHTMANINTLYEANSLLPSSVRVTLLLKDSSVCLLRPGLTTIQKPCNGATRCGLFAVGNPADVSTNGFKVDLRSASLNFHSLMRNWFEFDQEMATVSTDTIQH
ncbi:thiamine pyrophosphokinase 1-like [Clavelina lepadiformis]|uniref:thiamine pyrophosphokinase 1-like n=1 Tax=Clavelina lepadiformis TaxID=159417 RepID=UPI004042BE13